MTAPDQGAADQGAEGYDGPTVDHSTPGEVPPFPTDRPSTDALLAEVERLEEENRQLTGCWGSAAQRASRAGARADAYEAEVFRLRAGIAHIVDRYGSAPGIETCATMYDLRRLAAALVVAP